MKTKLLQLIVLVILLVISSLKGISQTTRIDSVLVPISYIRAANLLFVDRDRLYDELDNCLNIKAINDKIIIVDDKAINKLEAKVSNLELVIYNNNTIHSLEIDKLNAIIKKDKKERAFIIGGSCTLILLLILL